MTHVMGKPGEREKKTKAVMTQNISKLMSDTNDRSKKLREHQTGTM